MDKSPFILIENAIDKEACDDIISSLNHNVPNIMDGKVVVTLKFNKLEELRHASFIDDLLDYAEKYYEFEYQSMSSFMFEWYPEGFEGGKLGIDGWTYFNNDLIKSKEIDFIILMFLSTEKTENITNLNTEHVGGGLQFPTHNFTLHANAGDVLMFPATNNFINSINTINLGNMNLIRILITAKTDYNYDRRKFPGSYKTWFS